MLTSILPFQSVSTSPFGLQAFMTSLVGNEDVTKLGRRETRR